jgi:hypothetical protein
MSKPTSNVEPQRAPESRSPYQIAHAELNTLGLVLKQTPGEYRINYRGGTPATEYTTDDLQDALQHGREMAAHAPPPAPSPLGPTGPRGTRRYLMYRHNKKVAAQRRKKAANGNPEKVSPVVRGKVSSHRG